MRVEIEKDDVRFKHDGKEYSLTGTAIHNPHDDDIGIGSYEYHGSRGFDSQPVSVSEFEDCEFVSLAIYPIDSSEEVVNPSKELVEAAQDALFSATSELAEQKAAEDSD
jgi:hypothetical protein